MDWNKCRFCDAKSDGPHGVNCPTLDKNPDWATKEWQKGYDRGVVDDLIHYWQLQSYSVPFRIGYLKGRDEVDRAIEDAEQARLNFPHQEY